MQNGFQIDERTQAAVVTLRGELDAHDAPALRQTFVAAIDSATRAPALVIDLTAVAFLDSTVLGAIVGAFRRVRESEGRLVLALPESPARRIFEITGLDQVLTICPTREDALAEV